MEAIREMTAPREKGSPVLDLPLSDEGPSDFFPAVCLQNHWDPTMILKRTLSAQSGRDKPTRVCSALDATDTLRSRKFAP